MALATRSLRAFPLRSRVTPVRLRRATWSVICLLAISAQATTTFRQLSKKAPFPRAQHLQEVLEARPESQRTRSDYEQVLNAYRAIYHGDPASTKADASINAVAELLAEEGRLWGDEKLLHAALGQYEFLRTQYPASRFRFSALIAEGDIYRNDLNDREAAKQTFQQFLLSYPENPLAEQARTELNEIRKEERPRKVQRAAASQSTSRRAEKNPVLAAAIDSQPPQQANSSTPPAIQQKPTQAKPTQPPSSPPPVPETATTPVTISAASPPPATLVTEQSLPGVSASPPLHPGKVAVVSGIRHWSTPVYTRIAIDLGDQVSYEAARVPGPDRIYFDLHGAHLESKLNGKSVEVIDDGFLKRIRVAQFSNNITRIVLDVSSVSDYSAFLLPNPWRLIIDVHGRKPAAPKPDTEMATNPAGNTPSAPPVNIGATPNPNTPALQPPPAGKPPATRAETAGPRQVAIAPTRQADSRAGSQEIASLGQQPDRIQATSSPTTRPIAASVAGTTPAPQADDGSLASPAAPPVTTRSRKKPSPMHTVVPAPTDDDDNPPPATHEAVPTSAGQRSLVRTLGLKIGRIVIDAGHGGHDSGTLGPGGIEEKEVVLDVALRLGKLLRQRLGADVIFTRDDDTFIPLETRTAIANKAQADLFLSIHANSSSDSSARGVETYYLNFTTSPDALEVAARENAVSDESIHELSGLVKKITLKDKIDESREFAADVQKSLYDDLEDGNPGMRDRGVKKAPFVVLIGANMPSILAEISFLTNSDDARQLRQAAYRQRIAESLYRGVSRYISGLSGIRLAQTGTRPSGNDGTSP